MRKIICHGDSLTEGADIESAYRWPSLLQNALGHVAVVNTGIGGDTTAGLLSRFTVEVVALKPEAVILMGGTNDFWWGIPVNMVMANLYATAYQARYHGIAPLFGLPIPFDRVQAQKQPWNPPEPGYDQMFENVQLLRQKLTAAAGESDIPVLDFYGLFLDDGGHVNPSLFLDDGVHPNGQGHRKMAALAESEIRKKFFMSTVNSKI